MTFLTHQVILVSIVIRRFIFNRLREELTRPEINILLGPRQVGKTTLLKELEQFARAQGHSTAFFDLEQPNTLAHFNRPDKHVIETLTGSGKIIFIDEFQYIQNASKIFKAVFDAGRKTKIICSGSSSFEIHKHLKESLSGRRLTFRIFPCSLAELVESAYPITLESFLQHGGMPGLTHADSNERKEHLLSELLASYILKDVRALVKEENIRAFNHLVYLLAGNQGSVVSVNSLANEIKMSAKAIHRYLDILEATYANSRVYSFSKNLGNELKKSFKTYLYDLGIRNAILKDFSLPGQRPDKGALFETFVFLTLQQLLTPATEIKFWRTKDGDEVDFILLYNRQPIPIEVKSRLNSTQIPQGLRRFLLRYPTARAAYVINENLTDSQTHNSCLVHFITFEQFSRWKKLPLPG